MVTVSEDFLYLPHWEVMSLFVKNYYLHLFGKWHGLLIHNLEWASHCISYLGPGGLGEDKHVTRTEKWDFSLGLFFTIAEWEKFSWHMSSRSGCIQSWSVSAVMLHATRRPDHSETSECQAQKKNRGKRRILKMTRP